MTADTTAATPPVARRLLIATVVILIAAAAFWAFQQRPAAEPDAFADRLEAAWLEIAYSDREQICAAFDHSPQVAVSLIEAELGDAPGYNRAIVAGYLENRCVIY